ncbi:hypothetical protein BX666DRAFT_1937385 [Dichotomocladium elegans]|nr:hypothetical protein BX666DRAFT_1937385 [Dichotomocladium elegans]
MHPIMEIATAWINEKTLALGLLQLVVWDVMNVGTVCGVIVLALIPPSALVPHAVGNATVIGYDITGVSPGSLAIKVLLCLRGLEYD